jgi:RNA polymerase sigma factor (sigma-70 family)
MEGDDMQLANRVEMAPSQPETRATVVDREGFERFVARSQSLVCAVAYSALHDRALSEEAAQDAFLIAWRTLPAAYDAEVLPTWLCGIVRRVAANVRRKRRREVATMDPASQIPSPEAGPLDELLAREDAQLAARALAALSAKYREPLVLFYRGEQSLQEVAGALGLSEAAVKQRLHRGRKLLKESLAGVVRTLEATRPGPAFTAATVAVLLAGKKSAAAEGSALQKTTSGGAKLLAANALLAAVPVGLAAALVGAYATHRRPNMEVAPVVAAPVAVARPGASPAAVAVPAVARGAVSATTGGRAAGGRAPAVSGWRAALQRRLDLDFAQASSYDLIHMISDATDIPILIAGDITANVNVRIHDMTAVDALDEVLAQAGAQRREVPCWRVVASPGSAWSETGGGLVTASFEAAELRDVLAAIEAALGTPIVIGRDVTTAPMTIRFEATPASVALGQVLRQASLGIEPAVAFKVTPDAP